MKFYHAQVDGHMCLTLPIAATAREEAWNYSLTSLKPGDYVFELWDSSRTHRVENHVRRGIFICDEIPFLPYLGCVVAYCDTDMRVRYLEPFTYLWG